MLKILIITPYLSPIYGGTSKSIIELARETANLDVSVDIITTNANLPELTNLSLKTWIKENNYRIKYFPAWYRNDFIFSFSLITWLLKNISSYDLIHTNTLFSPLISLTHLICRLLKKAYIITPHGMLDPWALSYKAWKKKYYYQIIEKYILKQATSIQTLSNSEANIVNNLGFTNTTIVPNGIDQNLIEQITNKNILVNKYPQLKNKTLILFLGRIDPKKGLDLLAPAFAKAHRNFPNTHLIIAGPDNINFMPTAEQYFIDAGCRDAVTFTGMLKGDLKLSALAAADIYVAPSYSEGFSMSVLEGMVSGLPCVITTGCNFPEAARAKVAHVVDIDSEAIASALLECLHNLDRAKEMGDRARQFILDNYTWDKIAMQMKEVYQRISDKQIMTKN
ncbi:MAG: glycosyltransferase [Xenococcaceae cyanobacterium]